MVKLKQKKLNFKRVKLSTTFGKIKDGNIQKTKHFSGTLKNT
jgi:hypothetical protein